MHVQVAIGFAALTVLSSGCAESPTSPDVAEYPAPLFTARVVAPDSIEITIDNRASSAAFLMSTCSMSRERLEDGVWSEVPPGLGDPAVQCLHGGRVSFAAGEVTSFRQAYVASGRDEGLERVRTHGMIAAAGTIKVWPTDAAPVVSKPFPGGLQQ